LLLFFAKCDYEQKVHYQYKGGKKDLAGTDTKPSQRAVSKVKRNGNTYQNVQNGNIPFCI